jgi:hypothetical protein
MTRVRFPAVALLASALAAVAAPLAAPAAGQDYPPLVVEARVGAAIPTASFRTGPDAGGAIARAPSFGLHFVYRGPSGWGPYVGFSQHRFDCRADGCPAAEYVATSWDLGMQRTLGARNHAWVRLGFVFGRMERDFAAPGGPRRRTSMLSAGPEAGLGFRVPVRGRLSLTPGARWAWLNTQFDDGPLVRMRWLAADLGVALGF